MAVQENPGPKETKSCPRETRREKQEHTRDGQRPREAGTLNQ